MINTSFNIIHGITEGFLYSSKYFVNYSGHRTTKIWWRRHCMLVVKATQFGSFPIIHISFTLFCVSTVQLPQYMYFSLSDSHSCCICFPYSLSPSASSGENLGEVHWVWMNPPFADSFDLLVLCYSKCLTLSAGVPDQVGYYIIFVQFNSMRMHKVYEGVF